jgi:hypothetical protein
MVNLRSGPSCGMRDNDQLTKVRAVGTTSFLVTAHDQPCLGLDDARRRYEGLRAPQTGGRS